MLIGARAARGRPRPRGATRPDWPRSSSRDRRDQRRVRLVCLQQPAERLAQRPHHLPVEWLLKVRRSKAAGEQQAVALGDRQVEVLGQVDKELPARTRATGLYEAEVL